MKNIIRIIFVILIFSTDGISRYNPKYDKTITKEDLVNFVKEAVIFARIYGKKAAFREFNDKEGLFSRGDLYIYAYDMNCVVLSHGSNLNLIGKDLSNLKDPKGQFIIQEMVKQIKSDGKGWLKFYWFHPMSKRIMPKYGYLEKVDSTWWVGSGIYMDSFDED